MSLGASRRGFLVEVNSVLCVITKRERAPCLCPAQVAEVGGNTETAELSGAVVVHSSCGERSLLLQPCAGNCCITSPIKYILTPFIES